MNCNHNNEIFYFICPHLLEKYPIPFYAIEFQSFKYCTNECQLMELYSLEKEMKLFEVQSKPMIYTAEFQLMELKYEFHLTFN